MIIPVSYDDIASEDPTTPDIVGADDRLRQRRLAAVMGVLISWTQRSTYS